MPGLWRTVAELMPALLGMGKHGTFMLLVVGRRESPKAGKQK